MDAQTDIARPYALAEQVGPLVRRVLARTPSAFTHTGTQTYLVGEGADVAVIDPGPDDAEHLDALIEAVGNVRIVAIQIGRAHVRTPVTNAPIVCRLRLEKKKTHKIKH